MRSSQGLAPLISRVERALRRALSQLRRSTRPTQNENMQLYAMIFWATLPATSVSRK